MGERGNHYNNMELEDVENEEGEQVGCWQRVAVLFLKATRGEKRVQRINMEPTKNSLNDYRLYKLSSW